MGRGSRTAIAIGAVAALGAGLTACTAEAGPTTASDPDPTLASISPVAHQDLAPATSCDDLLAWYVDRGLDQVTAWGWRSPVVYFASANMRGAATVPLASPQAGVLDSRAERVTVSKTGTNVQEAGVDEPDVVKTDGTLLVRVQDGDLVVYDVTGPDPERLSSLPLRDSRAELLLDGDRVVALTGGGQRSRVVTIDLADPAAPEVVDEATYDAGLVTARLHGDTVRTVLTAHLPRLGFARPHRGTPRRSALEANRDAVRESTLEDWLPTVERDGETEQLLDCADVAIPSDDAGLGTLAVVAFDPAAPTDASATAVATASDTTYFSQDALYLATAPPSIWGCCWGTPVMGGRGPALAPVTDGSTRIYAFDLAEVSTTYAASATLDGAIRDRWAMDEVDGVLRVAVGPTQDTGNFNSIVTLERDGSDMVEVGRLDRLGVNETIRSVRWFDDLAYLVTFRQVDPLYAIDLTDPAEPRLRGKLKIPGYSEYLHPLGRHRMVGVGQGPVGRHRWGARAAVFNISDPARPRLLHSLDYRPGTYAGAGTDPRQFTWLPDRRTALTVVSRGRTGWVSVLTLDGGEVEHRLVQAEYGSEIDDVRTVPLPDGRVVLVTGEDVSRFDL